MRRIGDFINSIIDNLFLLFERTVYVAAALGVFLVFFYEDGEILDQLSLSSKKTEKSLAQKKRLKAKTDQKNHMNRVNHYLQDLEDKRSLGSAQVEIANHYYAPEVDDLQALLNRDTSIDDPEVTNYGINMDQSMTAQQIYSLLAEGSERDSSDPYEEVSRKLLEQQFVDAYNQELDEKYIDEFVANAKKAGFKVILDKELRVRAVRKIKKYESLHSQVYDGN